MSPAPKAGDVVFTCLPEPLLLQPFPEDRRGRKTRQPGQGREAAAATNSFRVVSGLPLRFTLSISGDDPVSVPLTSDLPPPSAMVRCKTVVISDTHLGKQAASAAFLFEFLSHLECDRLILNGDILEGWGMKTKRRTPFPEMHARCLDALNALAAKGCDVIYLRGNHDEDLGKKRHKLVGRTIQFRDRARKQHAPISFAKSYVHIDAQNRNFLVLHGDVFDSFMRSTQKKVIAQYADRAYEGFVHLNGVFRQAVYDASGIHVSPAAYLKRKTKKLVGIIEDFERAVTGKRIIEKFDGVICGHIHHAEIAQKEGILYMNSGDWVEGCTALTEDRDGNWAVVDWAIRREELGLTSLPTLFDPNPFAEYRGITGRQVGLVRRLWPGRDFGELRGELRDIHHRIDWESAALAEVFARESLRHSGPEPKSAHKLRNSLGKLAAKAESLAERLLPLRNIDPS